jgi:hypothetical protein
LKAEAECGGAIDAWYSFSHGEKVPEGRMRAGADERLALTPQLRDKYEHFA